jgi:hypothetical protein
MACRRSPESIAKVLRQDESGIPRIHWEMMPQSAIQCESPIHAERICDIFDESTIASDSTARKGLAVTSSVLSRRGVRRSLFIQFERVFW